MTAVIVPVAIHSDPIPAYTPQTFDRAIKYFKREIKAMKKKSSLAGQIEMKLAKESKTLLREACRELLQSQADRYGPYCPICGTELQNVEKVE